MLVLGQAEVLAHPDEADKYERCSAVVASAGAESGWVLR